LAILNSNAGADIRFGWRPSFLSASIIGYDGDFIQMPNKQNLCGTEGVLRYSTSRINALV